MNKINELLKAKQRELTKLKAEYKLQPTEKLEILIDDLENVIEELAYELDVYED